MIGIRRNFGKEAELQVRGLFADDGAVERGVAWAREVLDECSLDPASQPLEGIRALRRADRRLSLIAARYLVDAVVDAAQRGR